MFISIQKNERKTWEIELLIYRIYCWETKNKSFREMRKSQQSKEGVYQHQIRELKQWNCSAQSTQKTIEGMKALSKFFSWSNRNSTFWQIWHLKSLNSYPNCRSCVSQHGAWNIWQDISATAVVAAKKLQQFDFLKNRFHSQLLWLTLILGFFCRSLLCPGL